MHRLVVLGALILTVSLALTGCGSSSDADSTETSSGGSGTAAITMPEGWTMGDAVIRVDWAPDVYTEDPAAFGAELANALLQKMYE